MKKITTLLLLSCILPLFAQHKIPVQVTQLLNKNTLFKPVAPLTAFNPHNIAADSLVRNATYAKLDTGLVINIFKNKPEHLQLTIPYGDSTITMQLYRVVTIAAGFHIDTDKGSNIAYTPGAYYHGIIKGDVNSIAAFSFFENEMYGIVSAAAIDNVVVGRLKIPGNTKDYIIYSDANLKQPHNFECTTRDIKIPHNAPVEKNGQGVLSEHCVSLYFELRNNAYVANGSSVSETANWFTAMYNNVQALFENDGINTAIKSMYVWTEADPYDQATPSAYGLLDQFAAQTPIFDADAAQLINYGGGNGLAYEIGALCSDLNRSYAKVNPYYQPLPAYSQAVKTIAHELGHTFGSQHTHGCYWNGNNTAIDGCSTGEGDCPPGPIPSAEQGGTIMSYCGNINFANGFGPQPAQRILQHIAGSACLGTDCVTSCINTISALNLTDTTLSTATFTWDDTEANSWQVGYALFGEEITNWQDVIQNSFIAEGLEANTYYTLSVRNACGTGITAGSKTLSFSTGANWCSGAVWTDTGGATGNYTGTQHTVTIIKPQGSNQAVTVTFNDFWTQLNDIVYVYNGIGTSAPLIGNYSGYTPPTEPFVATNVSGALTFEFITDQMVYPSDGWAATVECLLSSKDLSFANLQYYPSPVRETITITAPNGFSNITLYNMAGQLLSSRNVEATSDVIDMSAYSSGIYILKISRGNTETHLKIIKE